MNRQSDRQTHTTGNITTVCQCLKLLPMRPPAGLCRMSLWNAKQFQPDIAFNYVITTHKRSLGKGNVFTPVCYSVQGEGRGSPWTETPWAETLLYRDPLDRDPQPPGQRPSRQRHTQDRDPPDRDSLGPRPQPPWTETLPTETSPDRDPPDRDPLTVQSGRYSSYWIAFLFEGCYRLYFLAACRR